MLDHAGPNCFRRFLVHCADYVNAVAREAELREQGQVLGVAAFETLRRENSAIRLCFGLMEFAMGFDLPDIVFCDEHFMTLYWAAADMVCWSNVSRAHQIVPLLLTLTRRMSILTTWNKHVELWGTTSFLCS